MRVIPIHINTLVWCIILFSFSFVEYQFSWLSWYFQRTKFSTAVCTRHIARDVINKNESDEKRINRQLILYHSTKIDFNESKCTLSTIEWNGSVSASDASYQVSVHLAKRFLRRRFLKISQTETGIACDSHMHVC
jgi:hypothetical protein